MALKKFDEFSARFSNDPDFWKNRIILASNQTDSFMFETIRQDELIKYTGTKPIIIWNDFSTSLTSLHENRNTLYNSRASNSLDIDSVFKGSKFMPSSTSSRNEVKKLKFPIVATGNDNSRETFKTYGKFKKSEENFTKFRSLPSITTKFEVLCSKDQPIHIQEKINGLAFDINNSTFSRFNEVSKIVEEVHSKIDLDFYQLNLIESNDRIYLDNITISSELSPSQILRMYEAAHYLHYESRLPSWLTKSMFENYVIPYYASRYYDSKLLRPKYSIDFEKYLSYKK